MTAPIVNAIKAHQLDDAFASLNVKRSADAITPLEERYLPHAVTGFV